VDTIIEPLFRQLSPISSSKPGGRQRRDTSGLLTLADVARRDARFSKLEYDALESTAHELIGPFVLTLNEWRVENHDPGKGISVTPPTQSNSFGKVGRNDPCPCGSGKKYKKCCGLN
jgi:uncharacterized protein